MAFFESDGFFKEITTILSETDVPFDDWWNDERKWGNGFRKFELPRDELKKIAFLYQLCLKMYNKKLNWLSVQLEFFGSVNVNENIQSFNTHIMEPLSDYIYRSVTDQEVVTNKKIIEPPQVQPVIYQVQGNLIQQGDRSIAIGDRGEISHIASGDGAIIVHHEESGKTYEVPLKDSSSLEKVAIFLINHLGEKKLIGVDIAAAIGSFFSIIGWLKNFFNAGVIFFEIGILFVLILILITKVIFFYRDAKCDKCGKDFAVFESAPRLRRDVESNGVIYRREERFYECRYCGNKTSSKHLDRFEKQG